MALPSSIAAYRHAIFQTGEARSSRADNGENYSRILWGIRAAVRNAGLCMKRQCENTQKQNYELEKRRLLHNLSPEQPGCAVRHGRDGYSM